MEKFQEFVAIAPWTMIFTWVNLLILVLVLKKLLFKPVMEMFAQREKEVGSMYEKAEEAQKNAQEMESEYTQKLAAAKEEASRIMKDATHEATLRGEQIVAEAQQKASAITIKEDIAALAVNIAEKVIEKDLTEKDHERLLEEFIDGSGEAK